MLVSQWKKNQCTQIQRPDVLTTLHNVPQNHHTIYHALQPDDNTVSADMIDEDPDN
ncbi:hypothetical protein C0J52_08439 [Blattella germanica]|nr:hypothetical protein C0J52_08439 [Blattella germanica]